MHAAQYGRFLIVGAIVGVATVACRELIGHVLPADTPVYYSVSIALAYAIGIVLSFLINGRFTFRGAGTRDWRQFCIFVAVALTSVVTTWLFSLAFRYGLGLNSVLGEGAAAVAFAAGALCSTAVTYPLNALLVFKNREQKIAGYSKQPM